MMVQPSMAPSQSMALVIPLLQPMDIFTTFHQPYSHRVIQFLLIIMVLFPELLTPLEVVKLLFKTPEYIRFYGLPQMCMWTPYFVRYISTGFQLHRPYIWVAYLQ